MAGFSGPAIVSADLKLAIDPADDVCNGGKSVMSDLVGSYDGTLQSGNGLYFDGSNDYVVFPGTGSVDNEISTTIKGSTKYSISLWIYNKDVTAYKSIWGVYNTHELHTYNNGQLWWWHNGGQTIKKTSGIANDTWYHVVCTWNGSTRYLYVDGALGASASDSQATLTNGTNMVIGDQGLAGRYWNGQISDFRLYNCYLDATQVKHLYENPNAVLPGAVSGSQLVGWWPLIEGSGTTAYDNSSNSNNGTLTNGPTWVSGSATIPQTATGFEYSSSLVPNPNKGWFDFDGTAEYMNFGASVVPTTDFSVELWAMLTSDFNNDHIFATGKMQTVNEPGFWIQGGTYKINARLRESTNSTSYNVETSANYNDNNWHHIAVTWGSNVLTMVIDNGEETLTENTSGTASHSRILTIGKAYDTIPGEHFPGKLTSIKIYERALSLSEISQNFNAQRGRFGV